MTWDRLGQLVRKVPWGRVVILVYLVLPVVLVLLAVWALLDPQARQALREWLARLDHQG